MPLGRVKVKPLIKAVATGVWQTLHYRLCLVESGDKKKMAAPVPVARPLHVGVALAFLGWKFSHYFEPW